MNQPMRILIVALVVLGACRATSAQHSTATLTQTGTHHLAEVTQTGSANAVVLLQVGAYGEVRLEQLGQANQAIIEQNLHDALGRYNRVLLAQADGAFAEVYQAGDHNVVEGLVPGSYARSLGGSALWVSQTGQGHVLQLDQQNGALATVLQRGTSNGATIIQR